MSPSEPPTRINDASVKRYPFDTHCCAGSPPPRSRSIAGRATLTIVPSIVATPEPRIAATSVSRCRRVIPPRRFRAARRAAAAATRSRLGSRLDGGADLVDVAPDPVLARLRRPRDRVPVVARVPARVPVRRGVAAPDLPAARAHPQVHPAAADREALLAAVDRLGEGRDADLIEVRAVGHRFSSGLSRAAHGRQKTVPPRHRLAACRAGGATASVGVATPLPPPKGLHDRLDSRTLPPARDWTTAGGGHDAGGAALRRRRRGDRPPRGGRLVRPAAPRNLRDRPPCRRPRPGCGGRRGDLRVSARPGGPARRAR